MLQVSPFLVSTTRFGFVDYVTYSQGQNALNCYGCYETVHLDLEFADQSRRNKRQTGGANQPGSSKKRSIERCTDERGDSMKPRKSSTPKAENKCDEKNKNFDKLSIRINEFNVISTRDIDTNEFVELKSYVTNTQSIRSWSMQG